MKLYLIRHGITEWNQQKKIQGRIDQPLSQQGIASFASRKLPDKCIGLHWYASPLLRVQQTAELLRIKNPTIDQRLIEMHWGDWEGHVLKPLRRKIGEPMRANERRGLDFQPPNGESPRLVQQRVLSWLRSLNEDDQDVGAVVHKGIIRCLYALAFDWDMIGESPVDFDWNKIHVFEWHAGRLSRSHSMIDYVEIEDSGSDQI